MTSMFEGPRLVDITQKVQKKRSRSVLNTSGPKVGVVYILGALDGDAFFRSV